MKPISTKLFSNFRWNKHLIYSSCKYFINITIYLKKEHSISAATKIENWINSHPILLVTVTFFMEQVPVS